MLGSINLNEFVNLETKTFNTEDFKNTVEIAVKALNEVLDEGLLLHPLKEQQDSVRDWRQIGLGIMGISDMLINMKIEYGSQKSIDLCDSIGFVLADTALRTSAKLAKEYSYFPKCNIREIIDTPYFKNNTTEKTTELVKQYGLRNSQLLTIAPTGTLSTMLGISGGIEPIFANYYTRTTKSLHNEDKTYKVYTPIVKEYMEENNIIDDKDLPEYFITSENIPVINRIYMQSVWQKHIDAAISSTVNLPNTATIEDIKQIYLLAWEQGLKGITVYRSGCKREGILVIDKKEDATEQIQQEIPRGFIESVPEDLNYRKYKLKNGCGNLYFFVGVDEIEGKIYDVFTNTDAVGGCSINTQANSRLLSAGLRGGIPVEYLIEQLNKSGTCASYQSLRGTQNGMNKVKNMILNEVSSDTIDKIDKLIGTPVSAGKSCPSSIGYVLKNILKEFEGIDYESVNYEIATKKEVQEIKQETSNTKNKCSECGEDLIYEGGCVICRSCGWSRCS